MNKIISFNELSNLNKSSMIIQFYEELEYVAESVYAARNYESDNVSLEGIELNDDENISARYVIYDYSGSGNYCGPSESEHYEEFPIKYLWEEGWYEKERDVILQENLTAIRTRLEREKLEKIESARAEKELYLTLKKKYESA